MTVGSDVFGVVKKIFLVSEELTRLSGDLKEISRAVNQQDIRLAVIETTLSLSKSPTRLILPGN